MKLIQLILMLLTTHAWGASQHFFSPTGSAIEQLEQAEKEAARGNAAAQYDLGTRLMTVSSVRYRPAEGEEWIYRSATNGFIAAQLKMGAIALKKDQVAGFNWYYMAATNNSAEGQFAVGQMFDTGNFYDGRVAIRDGVFKCGSVRRQIGFEKNYKGPVVAPNWSAARLWYEKAAAQNHGGAINNLGALYYFGHGVKPDLVKACRLFRQAAALEVREATSNAKIAEEYMTPKQIESARTERRN